MNAIDARQWDSKVRSSSKSRIYHLFEWGLLLKEVHGYELFYLHQDGGIFPLALVKSNIFGELLPLLEKRLDERSW